MQTCHRLCSLAIVPLLSALTAGLTPVGLAAAGEGDTVPGAIWKYEMSKVVDGSGKRSGMFRIDGIDIYQPRDKKPTKVGVLEGKKNVVPNKGDQVKVEFNELRASDGSFLKCKGPITWDSLGEVHGRLIDASGAHWNFKASRVQE